MIYKRYSQQDLECEAERLLQKFDPALLKSPKEFDVYRVIETCLGVDYGWQYIHPEQKILGLTAFNEGYIWISPAPFLYDGIRPVRINLSKGEIVIDTTLTESPNRGRENFTVMHEVFHQVIHKGCFREEGLDYIHTTSAAMLSGKKRQLRTPLDFIEYQANACAAAFLMPRTTVPDMWYKISGYDHPVWEHNISGREIQTMAEIYQVSKQAMLYRLLHLGLLVHKKVL